MKPTILFFSFIVTFMYNVSIGQTLFTNNSTQNNNNNCPLMEVNIVAANNNSGLYGISYCNHGNAIANNAYIEIEISNGLAITQSTFPIGSILYNNNKYTFYLGDIQGLECSDFFLEIPNLGNISHCTKISIYPNDPCKTIIDDYMHNNNTGNGNGGGNDDGDANNTLITTMSATEGPRVASANGVGQTGTSNSVYEDHVFLNSVPCWDSLLYILGNGDPNNPNNQNTSTNNTSINTSLFNKWNDSNGSSQMDITAAFALLSIDEYCYQYQGNNTNNTNNIAIIGQNSILDVENPDPISQNGSSSTNTTTNTSILNTDVANVNDTKETHSTVSIHISPNPFSVSTKIGVNGANYQNIQVQILDVSGKTIKVLQAQEEQQITVQRDNLSQGIYFYRLLGDQKLIHTGKLVVR